MSEDRGGTAKPEPTEDERAAVDALLGPPATAWDGGERRKTDLAAAEGGVRRERAGRHLLLPGIHALQDRAGWVSPGGLRYLGQRLGVAEADAFGVASFYALFSLAPAPRRVVHVCTDLACQVAGAARGWEEVRAAYGSAAREANCLGLCEQAPAALVIEAGEEPTATALGRATADDLVGAAAGAAVPSSRLHMPPAPARPREPGLTEPPGRAEKPVPPGPGGDHPASAAPQAGGSSLVLLRRVGVVAPTDLAGYRAHGGYAALRRALDMGPAAVVREVVESGLLGRGGAAFPAGRKWEAVAKQPACPHYLVANADESEPGTFKDRALLENDPFALVESMTIAAFATGCQRGYVYLRGEYPRAWATLGEAVAAARAAGLLGDGIMGSALAFDIELFRGAGAYVCGEETAIFNSIEGYRGEPRNKPPYPTEVGLFGCPTVVNNVETLVNVLPVIERGGTAYTATGTGTGRSTGTKLFAVSGSVARPGVYEVAFGATLGELLDLAGGVPPGRALRAVLLGGAAGTFVGPDRLDLPLSFEGAAAAGATLGSGVVMVLDDTVELEPFLLRIAAFFRDESCGQCVPCRVGTVRQEESLVRLAAGRPLGGIDRELRLLADVGRVMRDASICGLGQTASAAIASAVDRLGAFRRAGDSS